MTTLADLLLNNVIPGAKNVSGTINKGTLYSLLGTSAKENPEAYPEVVQRVKELGDMFSTYEGLSVGLDDIEPEYGKRDALINEYDRKLNSTNDLHTKRKYLLEAQNKGVALAKTHPGMLRLYTESGGRGNFGQFLKTVVSPITIKDATDAPAPFLMRKSYSEGVSPGEFFMGASEARREVMKGNLATALPGDTAKQLSNLLNKVRITSLDCGTKNGIDMKLSDPNVIDRFEAMTNIPVDAGYVKTLSRRGKQFITVRSPLTCEDQPGVCKRCYGHDSMGKLKSSGTHIGLITAQSLSEPLTQMVLSSKHGGNLSRMDDGLESGMGGFRQIVDMPKIFKNKASIAKNSGRVTRIETLPSGGHHVYVDDKSHFVEPGRELKIRKGSSIQYGQQLSSGVIHPREITETKGLGEGRKFMMDTLNSVYSDSGVNMDKRNVELMVRENLNYVKALDNDPDGEYFKNEVIPLNRFEKKIRESGKDQRVDKDIIGKTLAEPVSYYNVGTQINPEIYENIRMLNRDKIRISLDAAPFEPMVYPLERIPSLSHDWASRMGHRRIKDTILQGAAEGYESDYNDGPIAKQILDY